MRWLVLLTVIVSCLAGHCKDNERQQVLIFRSTGEVNLLFSDEIKAIECTNIDIEGNVNDQVMSQRFVLTDTVLVVPIAEIDSVAFGPRNRILPKPTARRLNEPDFEYIIKVDENTIVYKSNTPSSILPKANEKIYFDGFNDLFPVGLCAQVTTVKQLDGFINVNFNDVEPAEVFDAYFFAGEYDNTSSSPVLSRGAEMSGSFGFERSLDFDNINVNVSGELGMKVAVVADVLVDYYHADFTIYGKTGIDMTIKSEDFLKIEEETQPLTLFVGTIGGVLQPRLQISGFVDFNAEMSLAYSMERTSSVSFSWTKRKDNVTIDGPFFNNPDDAKNEAKIEAYLKGSLHLGIKPMITIGTLFDRVGAGVDFKIGPEFSADFNLDIIRDLSVEHNPEYYAKAKLSVSMLKINYETYTYNAKHFFLFGEKEKHDLPFNGSWKFYNRTLNLFPNFSTKAVPAQLTSLAGVPSKPSKGITVSSKTDTEIEYQLQAGLEMVDTLSSSILNQVFVEVPIQAANNELQGIDAEFEMPQEDMTNTVVNAIFKYNGYMVKAAPATISDDILYMPITSLMSNGGAYIVSGQPVISQHDYDERTFIEGNYMPVPGNTHPFNRKVTVCSGVLIDSEVTKGNYNNSDRNIKLTFIDETTGTYNGEKFTYSLNDPQTGDVKMCFSDDRVLIFTIVEVNDSFVKIQFKNTNDLIILER